MRLEIPPDNVCLFGEALLLNLNFDSRYGVDSTALTCQTQELDDSATPKLIQVVRHEFPGREVLKKLVLISDEWLYFVAVRSSVFNFVGFEHLAEGWLVYTFDVGATDEWELERVP